MATEKAFDPIERIAVHDEGDGRVSFSGNTSKPFTFDKHLVWASDYDALAESYRELEHSNKQLLRMVNELLSWRKNPEAFKMPAPEDVAFLED